MSLREFKFAAVVDLASVPAIAETLVRPIRGMPEAVATTLPLYRADVRLAQMPGAISRLAEVEASHFASGSRQMASWLVCSQPSGSTQRTAALQLVSATLPDRLRTFLPYPDGVEE